LVGYGGENNLINIINIQTISLTSEVGELFEEDIIWRVDYVPDDQKYRAVLSLLKPDSSILDETSVAVEFVKPTMVISMTPNQLTSNSAAVIHIQVNNPSGADMHDYKLLIGYAAKEDAGMYSIGDVPLSLAAGGTFEKDIGWNERFVPSSGEFELRMILLLPDGTVFIETTTPFTFNGE